MTKETNSESIASQLRDIAKEARLERETRAREEAKEKEKQIIDSLQPSVEEIVEWSRKLAGNGAVYLDFPLEEIHPDNIPILLNLISREPYNFKVERRSSDDDENSPLLRISWDRLY